MRKIEIGVFKFDELDKKVQTKVLDKFRENETLDFLYDDLNEQLKEELKENNIEEIKDCKLLYDLSYSQGSGLCFEGLFKWKYLSKEYSVRIMNNGRYNHNRSCYISIRILTDDIEDNINEASDEILETFKALFYKITKKLEETGREEIEYQDKDETIIENIKANDYEFYADGRIYQGKESQRITVSWLFNRRGYRSAND
mgnify:CR=1 FL=1